MHIIGFNAMKALGNGQTHCIMCNQTNYRYYKHFLPFKCVLQQKRR